MSSSLAISPPPKARPRTAPRLITMPRPILLAAFLVSHAVLALIMRPYPLVATGHAIATVGVGMIYAATTRRIRNVTYIAGYIIGSEVLWRMTKARVFWEFGKYALVAVLLVALARISSRRNRVLALTYLGLLLPSALLTFTTLDLGTARGEVSFNLSGPLAIAVATLFFSNIRLTADELRDTFYAVLGPVVAIASLTFFTARARGALEFVNASNSATSGGFGPNQVSAMLGLGLMMLILLSFNRSMTWRARVPLLGLAAALAVQCAMTFARGGLLLAFAGVAASLFFLVRGGARMRITVILVSLVAFALGKYVIEPQLDELTGGKLAERYTSTKSSGRDLFIDSELQMFSENPAMGVGPGVGMYVRADRGLFQGASHTEYTRMLAEHGLLGVISLCCFVLLAIRGVRAADGVQFRALASAFVVWAVVFLGIYGIRLAAPALVFGLAFALRAPPRKQRAVERPLAVVPV